MMTLRVQRSKVTAATRPGSFCVLHLVCRRVLMNGHRYTGSEPCRVDSKVRVNLESKESVCVKIKQFVCEVEEVVSVKLSCDWGVRQRQNQIWCTVGFTAY